MALIDNGSEVNLMSFSTYEKIGRPKLRETSGLLTGLIKIICFIK